MYKINAFQEKHVKIVSVKLIKFELLLFFCFWF